MDGGARQVTVHGAAKQSAMSWQLNNKRREGLFQKVCKGPSCHQLPGSDGKNVLFFLKQGGHLSREIW